MERFNTAAARAVNALPRDEADQFDTAAGSNPVLQRQLDGHRAVAAELAEGFSEIVPAAPSGIWDRIVAETGIGDDHSRKEGHVPPRPVRSRFTAFSAVTAAFVIGIVTGNLGSSSPDLRDQASRATAASGSTTMELTSPSGEGGVAASIVLAGDGTGYVIADSLPALPVDRTYQLWVIVGDQVVSAGLLGNDPGVAEFRAEGDIAGLAISNEAAGGVVASEVDPTVLWLRNI